MPSKSTTTTSATLSNSLSSLSSSQTLPDITRTYKQSSQLFLTRRVAEALETLLPIIERPSPQPPSPSTSNPSDDQSSQQPEAPIATASRGARVKVWSLYISILNAIVEMGQQAGKEAFGLSRWRALCAKARDGGVWDEVQQIGYHDREGDIDADVVANLATLLLAHAPSQRLTQQRLEAYLAAVQNPSLDVSGHMVKSEKTNGHAGQNGTSTPRDLGSRLKILEIYTLHVLPRNEEWAYAREFIGLSEVLDEERKEAFLHALQGIEDERGLEEKKEEELKRQREMQTEELRRKEEESRRTQEKTASGTKEKEQRPVPKSTESDYGVSSSKPTEPTKNNSSRTNPPNGAAPGPKPNPHTRKPSKPSSRPPDQTKNRKSPPPPSLYRKAKILSTSMQQTILALGQNLRAHPVKLIRTLAFLVAIIMALARRDVRDRLERVREASWEKVKRTVGMRVKVSYI